MKHIDFDFSNRTYALSFTAEALFSVYEKYGVVDSILEGTGAFEPTEEGWVSCCWLLALMASQGELQRRHMGETPRPMLTLEDIRTGTMAGDVPRIRQAVRDCLEQGFRHEPTDAEQKEQEVNLVLQQREEQTKKALPLALSALDTLRQRLDSFLSASRKPSS